MCHCFGRVCTTAQVHVGSTCHGDSLVAASPYTAIIRETCGCHACHSHHIRPHLGVAHAAKLVADFVYAWGRKCENHPSTRATAGVIWAQICHLGGPTTTRLRARGGTGNHLGTVLPWCQCEPYTPGESEFARRAGDDCGMQLEHVGCTSIGSRVVCAVSCGPIGDGGLAAAFSVCHHHDGVATDGHCATESITSTSIRRFQV